MLYLDTGVRVFDRIQGSGCLIGYRGQGVVMDTGVRVFDRIQGSGCCDGYRGQGVVLRYRGQGV